MRSLLFLALAACTSTRMLADAGDARLRVPGHRDAFVVHTTEVWKERIDPATGIELGDAHGRWSQSVAGGELKVDSTGLWLDQRSHPWDAADAVRIEGMSERAAALIERTRPLGGLVERDGDAWVLSGARSVLERWLQELEINVARLEPLEFVEVQDDPQLPGSRHTLADDDAKLYQLRVVDHGAPLGTWSFSSRGSGWQRAMHGDDLLQFIDTGRRVRVGWKWSDIAHVRVTNLSGAKTLGGIVLAVGLSVGFFAVAGAAGAVTHTDPTNALVGGGSGSEPRRADWLPDLAPATSDSAQSLFATGTTVRWFIRPMLTFDGATAYRGDFFSSGVSARIRFADMFELGGGVREVQARTMMGSERSTTGNFQLGMHLPFDAAHRYAGVFGLDLGGGGHVDLDLRIPWGLRLAQGRWLATVTPATPQFLRIDGNKGRWAAAGGIDLGITF